MVHTLLCVFCLNILLQGLSVTTVVSALDHGGYLICHDDETAYLKIQVSFEECAKACQRRQICAGIGYRRRFTLCYLYNSLPPQLETAHNGNKCIFVSRISWTNIPVGDCVY